MKDARSHHAGGIYLFYTRKNAEKYMVMHEAHLAKMGFKNFVSKLFEINQRLTAINKGPLKPYIKKEGK